MTDKENNGKENWVYMVRCADGSLYSGWTNDLGGRMHAHKSGKGGAKYTRGHKFSALAYAETVESRSAAMKREAALKKLTKPQKEALCSQWADRMRPRLSFAGEKDKAEIAELYNWYVRNSTATFRYHTLEGEGLQEWFDGALRIAPVVVARDSEGRMTAFACAHAWRGDWEAYQWDVETTIYAAPGTRAMGAAGAAYDLLCAVLGQMGYWNAYAVLADPNPASEAFHTRKGFVLEGRNPRCGYKLERWVGISTWRLELKKGRAVPEPVRRLSPEELETLRARFDASQNV